MIAQHVHNTHLRDGHTIEIGALSHTGTDEQTAIRTSHNGQIVLAGIALADQVFGSSDEVVEDVLLLHLRTCQMPFLAIFVAATERYLCIDAAILEEGDAGAVLALEEHLLGGVVVLTEFYLWRSVEGTLILGHIVTVDGAGNGERGEGVEALRLLLITA